MSVMYSIFNIVLDRRVVLQLQLPFHLRWSSKSSFLLPSGNKSAKQCLKGESACEVKATKIIAET
jgi:hypothetical protein